MTINIDESQIEWSPIEDTIDESQIEWEPINEPVDKPIDESQIEWQSIESPAEPTSPEVDISDYEFIKAPPSTNISSPDFIETIDPDNSIRQSMIDTAEEIGKVYPVLETAATVVTSAYGMPLSGVAGVYGLAFGAAAKELGWTEKSADEVASDVIEMAQTLLVYEPKAELSQRFAQKVFYPFEVLAEVAKDAGEKVQDKTGSAVLGATVEGLIQAAPAALPFAKGIGKGIARGAGKTAQLLRLKKPAPLPEPGPRMLFMKGEKVKFPKLEDIDNISETAQQLGAQMGPDDVIEARRIYNENATRLTAEVDAALAKKDMTTFNKVNKDIMRNQLYEEAAKFAEGTLEPQMPASKKYLFEEGRKSSKINAEMRANLDWLKQFDEDMISTADESTLKGVRSANEKVIENAYDAIKVEEGAGILTKANKRIYQEQIKQSKKQVEDITFKLAEPAEARFQAAKGEYKSVITRAMYSTKSAWTWFKNNARREFEHLPRTGKYAPARNELLRLQKQKDIVSAKVLTHLDDVLVDLEPPKVLPDGTKVGRRTRKKIQGDNYDLFTKKLILDDIMEDVKLTRSKGPLYKNLSMERLRLDKIGVDKAVAENPLVAQAVQKRTVMWNELRTDYIRAMKDIGHDVSSKLNREHYFRHLIQDYENQKRVLLTTGQKLKEPTYRSFLKKRTGSEDYQYSTNYLLSESEVLTQMLHDIEVAKVIKAIGDEYDMKPKMLEDVLMKDPNTKRLVEQGGPIEALIEDRLHILEDLKPGWRNEVPEGHVRWQPREGSIFHTVESFEGVIEQLGLQVLEGEGITKVDIRRALAKDPRFIEYVIPEELATTLDNLSVGQSGNVGVRAHKKAVGMWKKVQLQSGKRFFKYNIRNLTGDAEAMFVGNAAAFKKVPKASKEIAQYYYGKNKGKPVSPELQQWIDRGGTMSTQQAQELGQLKSLNKFVDKQVRNMAPGKSIVDLPVEAVSKAWNKYWSGTRRATDFRESIFRYAAYLDYLEQMKTGKGVEPGMPKNYGASKPVEIKGLKTMEDRAFWLSNELLGAYDRVGKLGQANREHFMPFWSWKEVNMRRYKRFIQNAASDHKIGRTVAKSAVGIGVKTGVGLGMFLTKALLVKAGLETAFSWYAAEDDLPKSIKRNTHVTLGKNDEGEITYFSRMGTLDDALEWFGLEAPSEYWDDYFNKGLSPKAISKKWAKQAGGNWANTFVNGMEPFVKLGLETITGKSLYPDVLSPRQVQDRYEQALTPFPTIQDLYRRASRKPQRYDLLSYKTAVDLFLNRIDEHSAAYSDVMAEKIKFKKMIGKATEGGILSETSKALYNAKKAMKYRDVLDFQFWMKEYIKRGGTEENMERAIDRMDPLSGLTKDEQQMFIGGLDDYTQRKLLKAMLFYEDMRTGKVFEHPEKK